MKIYLTYRERIAGFFILVTIVLVSLFIIGAAVENLWFTPKTSYHVYVVRGDGLSKGSPVLFSGVEIGRVGDMTILKDGRIDVTLSILTVHAYRITSGIRAEIRRALGIGEKRVLLYLPPESKGPMPQLPPDAAIPVDEPRDLLDVVSSLDLGKYMETMDRAVKSLDVVMTKLDEQDRLERMLESFDKLGPTLDVMNQFFTDIDEPLLAVVTDPNVPRAFKNTADMMGDKKTKQLIETLAVSLEPEKVKSLINKSDKLIARLNEITEPEAPLQKTLTGTDRLLNDGKLDKMLVSMAQLTKEQQIEQLVRNMTTLSVQMAKIGPEIPGMAKELNATMRELSIVLKALQKTWLLDDEAKDVIKKMKKDNP